MRAVLECTSSVINDLICVAGNIGLKIGGRSPGVCASVGKVLNDRVHWLDVVARATEENEGHSPRGGSLESPVRRKNPGKTLWDLLTVHESVYGAPAGMMSPSAGEWVGFPVGPPTGWVYAAASDTKRAEAIVKKDFILI